MLKTCPPGEEGELWKPKFIERVNFFDMPLACTFHTSTALLGVSLFASIHLLPFYLQPDGSGVLSKSRRVQIFMWSKRSLSRFLNTLDQPQPLVPADPKRRNLQKLFDQFNNIFRLIDRASSVRVE